MLFHFEEIAVEEDDSKILPKADSNEVEEMPIEEEKNTTPSLKLVLDEIPIEFRNRYGELPASIYVRRCYLELYDMVTETMLFGNCQQPAFIFTGIPGIGKSMFLIYFLCRYSKDDRFEDKRFAFEVCSGQYDYYVPSDSDAGQYTCYSALESRLCPCSKILVVADTIKSEPPRNRAKWTLIFSSPDPLRYKEIMKGRNSCRLTLPTWSEEELCLVDRNVGSWYDRFVMCGGVPSIVLWNGELSDPMDYFFRVFEDNGAIVAGCFFKNSFGNIDFDKEHINPPRLNSIHVTSSTHFRIGLGVSKAQGQLHVSFSGECCELVQCRRRPRI